MYLKEEDREMTLAHFDARLTTMLKGALFEKFYGQSYSLRSERKIFEEAGLEIKMHPFRSLNNYLPILNLWPTFFASRGIDLVSH